jgi:hypothetical protein
MQQAMDIQSPIVNMMAVSGVIEGRSNAGGIAGLDG